MLPLLTVLRWKGHRGVTKLGDNFHISVVLLVFPISVFGWVFICCFENLRTEGLTSHDNWNRRRFVGFPSPLQSALKLLNSVSGIKTSIFICFILFLVGIDHCIEVHHWLTELICPLSVFGLITKDHRVLDENCYSQISCFAVASKAVDILKNAFHELLK